MFYNRIETQNMSCHYVDLQFLIKSVIILAETSRFGYNYCSRQVISDEPEAAQQKWVSHSSHRL